MSDGPNNAMALVRRGQPLFSHWERIVAFATRLRCSLGIHQRDRVIYAFAGGGKFLARTECVKCGKVVSAQMYESIDGYIRR